VKEEIFVNHVEGSNDHRFRTGFLVMIYLETEVTEEHVNDIILDPSWEISNDNEVILVNTSKTLSHI
jgi:hypothetical protein